MTARKAALIGLFFTAFSLVFAGTEWFHLFVALVAALIFVGIYLLSYFTRDVVRTSITTTEREPSALVSASLFETVTKTQKVESLDS